MSNMLEKYRLRDYDGDLTYTVHIDTVKKIIDDIQQKHKVEEAAWQKLKELQELEINKLANRTAEAENRVAVLGDKIESLRTQLKATRSQQSFGVTQVVPWVNENRD